MLQALQDIGQITQLKCSPHDKITEHETYKKMIEDPISQFNPLSAETNYHQQFQFFDFSHHPLPNKKANCLRIFYNNINGLEINN